MINGNVKPPLFRLGDVSATPGAMTLLEQTGTDVLDLLLRHMRGDWGAVCEDDAKANRTALEHGGRLLSAYIVGDNGDRIWIISEADRRATTLLTPQEY